MSSRPRAARGGSDSGRWQKSWTASSHAASLPLDAAVLAVTTRIRIMYRLASARVDSPLPVPPGRREPLGMGVEEGEEGAHLAREMVLAGIDNIDVGALGRPIGQEPLEPAGRLGLATLIAGQEGDAEAGDGGVAQDREVVGADDAGGLQRDAPASALEHPGAVIERRLEAQAGVLRECLRARGAPSRGEIAGAGIEPARDAQDAPRDEGGIGELADAQGDVEPLLDEIDVPAGQLELHPDAGMKLEEGRQRPAQDLHAELDRRAQAQESRGRLGLLPDRALGLGDLREDAHAALVIEAPLVGEAHDARRAVEEPDAEALLKLLDAMADGRFRQRQPPSRLGEAAGIDHGDEACDLLDHAAVPPPRGQAPGGAAAHDSPPPRRIACHKTAAYAAPAGSRARLSRVRTRAWPLCRARW